MCTVKRKGAGVSLKVIQPQFIRFSDTTVHTAMVLPVLSNEPPRIVPVIEVSANMHYGASLSRSVGRKERISNANRSRAAAASTKVDFILPQGVRQLCLPRSNKYETKRMVYIVNIYEYKRESRQIPKVVRWFDAVVDFQRERRVGMTTCTKETQTQRSLELSKVL